MDNYENYRAGEGDEKDTAAASAMGWLYTVLVLAIAGIVWLVRWIWIWALVAIGCIVYAPVAAWRKARGRPI